MITIIFLGRVNNSLKCLEVYFPEAMEHFYTLFNYKRGGTAGNKDFIGRLCREMISVEKLAELLRLIGEDGAEFVRYLSAIRELHKCMVAGKLEDYSYEDCVNEYSDSFNDVHELFGLPETVKCHIYRYLIGSLFFPIWYILSSLMSREFSIISTTAFQQE